MEKDPRGSFFFLAPCVRQRCNQGGGNGSKGMVKKFEA
jgi:hypothetical protein